jgi:hypothetical protein
MVGFERSGILTSKKSCTASPSKDIKTYSHIRIQKSEASSPLFTHMPEWLRPLLYCQHEHGYSEEWLCSLYQNISANFLSDIKTVFSAVITLILERIRHVDSVIDTVNRLSGPIIDRDMQCCIDKPWMCDVSGYSEDEIRTYDEADVAVMR